MLGRRVQYTAECTAQLTILHTLCATHVHMYTLFLSTHCIKFEHSTLQQIQIMLIYF